MNITPVITQVVDKVADGIGSDVALAYGYQFTIITADDELKLPEQLDEAEFPAVFVIDGLTRFEGEFAGTGDTIATVHIFNYVKQATAPRAECRKIIQDILRWFAKNETIYGLCELAKPTAAEMGDVFAPLGFSTPVFRPYAACRIDVDVRWSRTITQGW